MRSYVFVISYCILIPFLGVFFSGCKINDKLKWLDDRSGEMLEIIERDNSGDISSSTIPVIRDETIDMDVIGFTKETKQKIDTWLKDNSLNRYGDPLGTNYEKGTPLVEVLTGENIERFDYILKRIPDLMQKIKE